MMNGRHLLLRDPATIVTTEGPAGSGPRQAVDILRLDELIARISARMVKASADTLDDDILRSLREIYTLCGADRGGLMEVSRDAQVTMVSHAWYNDGVPQLSHTVNLAELYPWTYRQLAVHRKIVAMEQVDDLPAEAEVDRQSHVRMETKSSLTIPLVIGDRVHHLLGFGAVRNRRVWDNVLIARMQLVGEIFVSALQRREAERQARQHLEEIDRLRRQLELENSYLRDAVDSQASRRDLHGFGSMRKVRAQIEQVAGTDSTVLIQGETGTGKELIAEAIHRLGARRQRILVKVNCAALPAALVESELFGREKGAFTGALSRQVGRFELADGATLFLDEIAEMPLEIQSKLLRVLQEGEFERLGSPRTIKVNVRVVVATNRDLAAEVEQGRFRRDLFYRLNVFPILVPPLRERTEDIPRLVWEFINEFGERMGKKIRRVANDDMRGLLDYDWPGNVRELRNVIEHAMIMSRGEVLELERPGPPAKSGLAGATTLAELERQHILATLATTQGRIKGVGGAAARLGLNPSTLYSRMRKLGIHPYQP